MAVTAILVVCPVQAEFMDDVARIDQAIKENPSNVLRQSLESCLKKRNFAIQLYRMGETVRAERSLKYCYQMLQIPAVAVSPVMTAPSQVDLQAAAARELERALSLPADVANGLKIYRECAACHTPEGTGLTTGSVPQIAGQHHNVVIKQLADIRMGNRDTAIMAPYSSVETIGGAQAVADVAAYIDTLEISVATGKGPGNELDLGERLYGEHCTKCHGATGAGDDVTFTPRIHAQHYNYLVRQFQAIKGGKRRNANPEMVTQIQSFNEREIGAVLDYVSRLEPPEMMQAPVGWKNPDFE